MPLIVSQLKDKNIVVLGAGLTGLSCARFLQNNGLSFTVIDSRENPLNVDVTSNLTSEMTFSQQYSLGKLVTASWHSEVIKNANVIIASPGIDISVPEIAEHISNNCQVIGDVELYCQVNNQYQQTPILAVTGSNGKSTVVSLLAYLGQALGFDTELGGNIGVPVLEQLSNDTDANTDKSPVDFLVVELSSFQLETLTSMKAVAATILNISDDHLDRHKTLENYKELKQKIYQQSDIAVINRDDSLTQVTPVAEHQTIISFGSDEPSAGHFGIKWINQHQQLMFGEQALIAVTDLPLAGVHNALNCLAALALGMSAGWSLTAMVDKLSGFTGLAHRCQKVTSDDKINWINDSKATNVGATLAAIEGLSSTNDSSKTTKKLILIVGGEGKGADFSLLKSAFEQHVSAIITLGKDGDKFIRLSEQIESRSIETYSVASMEEAVNKAKSLATSGDTVLLSPACASLDMFKNYIERGNAFINAVKTVEQLAIKETF